MTFWQLLSSFYLGCLFWVHFKLFFYTSWGHLETAPLTSAHMCNIPLCFMTLLSYSFLFIAPLFYNDTTADVFSHIREIWVRVLFGTLSSCFQDAVSEQLPAPSTTRAPVVDQWCERWCPESLIFFAQTWVSFCFLSSWEHWWFAEYKNNSLS